MSEYIIFGIDYDDDFYGWDKFTNLDNLINNCNYVYCGQLYSRKDKLERLESKQYESYL